MQTQWDYKNHPHFPKPKDENGYLESMSRIVFSTGLNWNVVNKKWPDIQKSFAHFSVEKVAKFNDLAIEELLKDEKMIRSSGKIKAIIKNAKTILDVKKEFGSFRDYLTQTKKQGIDYLLKDLKKRFSYMGSSTSIMFLYGVGEESPELQKKMMSAHKKKG